MHTVITANTPTLFEIDLPGLHPTPVGWPEELIYSMMEVLANTENTYQDSMEKHSVEMISFHHQLIAI